MKRIAALGMIAITIAANLNPITTEAAGVRSYSQCLGGKNATIISSNCNSADIQSKLADLGIDSSNYDFSKAINSQNCPLNSAQQNCTTTVNPTTTALPETNESALEAIKAEVANTEVSDVTNCTTVSCKTTDCTANCSTANCETANCNTDNCSTTNCSTNCTSSDNDVATSTNTATNTTTTNNATTNITTTNSNAANTNVTNTNATKATTVSNSDANTNKATVNTNTQASNTQVSYAQQVVDLVNIERAKEGLGALTVDQNVAKAATIRANEIQIKFEHVRPDGSGFVTALKENGVTYRGAGENIAWGQKTPQEVVTGWMNSPGHRANIMNKNYVHIGVGNVQNSAGTQYWVQIFTY